MSKPHSRDGYILVMALMMISLALLMTSIMFDRGGSFVPYMKAVADRQKAKMVALGGLAVVQGQLARDVTVEQKEQPGPKQKAQKPNPDQEAQHLLKTIMPSLNRWQSFELREDLDGVDATLQVCLMSEEGKLNLNAVFDFEKKKFHGEGKGADDWKKKLEPFFERIEKATKTTELFKALEQFLKKRSYPLNDVTELLSIKAFEPFKRAIYYEPPTQKAQKTKKQRQHYALTDLFTLHSDTPTIEPWLLSDSMLGVLGINRAQPRDTKKRVETVAEWLKTFKIKAAWQKDWNVRLKNVYGIDFKSLPKGSVSLFGDTFEPRYFSALVNSTVGDATQRLFAILERIKKSQDTKTVYDVKIRKYYWL